MKNKISIKLNELLNKHFGKILLSVLGSIIISIFLIFQIGTISEKEIKVSDKELKVKYGEKGGSFYLVFTENGDVYKNIDNMLFLKFSSSNLQAKLKKEETYICKINGFRIPIFSIYKNILECKIK